MTDTQFTIADLRREREETLEQFAVALDLASKGQASEIERTQRCSLRVALTIEELSGRRIDAATLNDDVASARRAAA